MEKKRRIYEYIKGEVARNGLPPTIREIGKRFDISSTNGVRYFLNRLEEEGLIKRMDRTARGIRIIGQGQSGPGTAVTDDSVERPGLVIPILGRVPAGQPLFSEENVEGTIVVDRDITRGNDVFAVRVHGDSMIGVGINNGDLAVVKKNPVPTSGEIVVAMIDDEVTLKRFMRRGSKLVLKPENDTYPEIVISDLKHERIRIIGSVISVIRRFY